MIRRVNTYATVDDYREGAGWIAGESYDFINK